MRFTTKTLSIALAFAGTLAAAAPTFAQQAAGAATPREGWFKVCTKQGENDICNVQNIRSASTGQLLTAVNLIQITGATNRALFQIAVPTGRIIPAAVAMKIDGGANQKINYSICLPDRCVAEAPLTNDLVAALKRGGELTLTTVNFQNQPNPIKVSLNGFTAAFDGDPLQQSEVEDKQKELQAEIEKRREEFQQKLKDEQEKAKAAE